MWIFTDAANLADGGLEWVKDKAVKSQVDANASGDPALFADIARAGLYIGSEIASQQYVDLLRVGDGFMSGTGEGIAQDVFRGLSLITGGGAGFAIKGTKNALKAGAKMIDNSATVRAALTSYSKAMASQIVRHVPIKIHAGRVYTTLDAVLKSRGISTLRYQATGSISDLADLLKKTRIIKFFAPSSRSGWSLEEFGNTIGASDCIFLRMRVTVPNHQFYRTCVVHRGRLGSVLIKGDHGTYESFSAYKKAEFSSGARFDRDLLVSQVDESNTVRDIRFDFSKHRQLYEQLVKLEGVVLNNYNPVNIIDKYLSENPYID